MRGGVSQDLSVPSRGPILNYLQKGGYSSRWRLLEQVAHILLKTHLDVISLCGPGEQISCEGILGFFKILIIRVFP
jgi:hypothetical protein